MGLALSRVNDQIESEKLDKATEKRMEQQNDDLRQAILFAGARDAKLASLRDQMLLLGELLSKTYTEIIEKGKQSDEVTQIMQNLRKIAEENGNPSSPGLEDSKGEDERDTLSPRLLGIDPVNYPILSPSLLEELIPKLKTVEKAKDLFTVTDLSEKLVESEDSEKLLSNLYELVNIIRNAVDATIQRKEESMYHVRKELKQLKEDAATFASVRAVYAARCKKLQGTVENLMESMKTAEEEKKTLDSLLRMTLQQKLQAIQRLEDMQVDQERQSHRRSVRQQPEAARNKQQEQQETEKK